MKLRVRNNSIRLRLTQSEVGQFRETGSVEERIEFGAGAAFIYELKTAESDEINARFDGGRITIFVPSDLAQNWADSVQIGLENVQAVGDGKTLKILIEKDFACIERTDGEDESDAFPHPKAGAVC